MNSEDKPSYSEFHAHSSEPIRHPSSMMNSIRNLFLDADKTLRDIRDVMDEDDNPAAYRIINEYFQRYGVGEDQEST